MHDGRRILRRDLETFFLGTAMTISRTGRPPGCKQPAPAPKTLRPRSSGRGGPSSSQNVAPPQQFSVRGGLSLSAARPAKGCRRGSFQAGRPLFRAWARTSSSFTPGASDRDRPPAAAVPATISPTSSIFPASGSGVGLGVQQRLAALGMRSWPDPAGNDAESVVRAPASPDRGQNACLDDFSAQTALDHDLPAWPEIHGHTG